MLATRFVASRWKNLGLCLFALVAACLLPTGCTKEPTTPTILDQRAQPFVQDVPVPRNFELDARNSDHKIVAGRRSVNHVYRGSDKPLAVRNFYVHYMPMSQWQLVNEKLHAGVYLLHFKKNEEKCEVRIEPVPAGMFGKPTQVRATVKSIYAETPTD
jgi:hypothetical protein